MKLEKIWAVCAIWNHDGSWPVKLFRSAEDAYALERACAEYAAHTQKPIYTRDKDFDAFIAAKEKWCEEHPLPPHADADAFDVEEMELF